MFYLSKILSAITQPMFWLAIGWFTALLILTKWRRVALGMLWTGLLILFLLGFEAFPNMLLRPLENRFPAPQAQEIAKHAGFIVLGGATGHPNSFLEHGQVPLSGAAERMTVPVGWMLIDTLLPLKLVFPLEESVVNAPLLGVVFPIVGGLARLKVPPRVRFPLDVTVPLRVIPLTVPVPLTLVTVPPLDGLVLVIVIAPELLVTEIPVPAVNVDSVNPVPLPISNAPFAGVEDNPVPPLTTGTTPANPVALTGGNGTLTSTTPCDGLL